MFDQANETIDFDKFSLEDFEKLNPILEIFFEEFKSELDKLDSFFCAFAKLNDQTILFIGAEDSYLLKVPSKFNEYEVKVEENSIELSANFEDIYRKNLEVGCEIGMLKNEKTLGTLGGFVEVDKEIYGITCHHVVHKSCKHSLNTSEKILPCEIFQQPSEQTISEIVELSQNDEIMKRDLSCGRLSEYGFQGFISNSLIDYQLLIPEREIKSNFIISDKFRLKPPVYDLNTEAKKFFNETCLVNKFGKSGAATGVTFGKLYSPFKNSVYLKINGLNKVLNEFTFISNTQNKKFVNRGDSGSIVFYTNSDYLSNLDEADTFKQENGSVIGLAFASTSSKPYIAFVTPFNSIIEHFEHEFKRKISFI